ncbi:MAG TPA: hypothetical protein VF459_16015 [Caulobacteraceae bacterium]
MDLKPGSRWKSAVSSAEVVVVRPPSAPVVLECGGVAMLAPTAERPAGLAIDPAHAGASLMGKRYVDADTGLEALCAKPGEGALSVNGRPLTVRDAKKLPSSD